MSNNILIITRRPRPSGNYSIEGIAKYLNERIFKNSDLFILPHYSSSLFSMLSNMLCVYNKAKGYDHVLLAGDINYAGLFCFRKVTAIIHDIYIVNNSSGIRLFFYKYIYFVLPINLYLQTVTVSSSSKRDLDNLTFSKKALRVINPPLLIQLYTDSVDLTLNRKYDFISIGNAPNKRVDLIEEIVTTNPLLNFVHVGSKQFSANNIASYNNITNQELVSLYCDSRALLFVSDFEGYGLPIIEGLILGCDLVITDLNVFRETLEKIGLGFTSYLDFKDVCNKDLIYVKNTPETRIKVYEYLDSIDIEWKNLF